VAWGANRATVVKYANSGDSPVGQRGQVVGYGAVVFWQGQGNNPGLTPALPNLTPPSTDSVPLTDEDRAALLRLARDTLTQYLADGRIPRYDPPSDSPLRTPSAVFVTLKRDGQLRGCIGDVVAQMPLYLAVQRRALAAALEDPRFPAVQADELPHLTIEVSVLSPMTPVGDVAEIVVGTHGLFIVKGDQRGLLLPQVPVEQGWDRAEFLRQVCRKAGLPDDAWQHAQLYRFTADVFGEETAGG
jgi:AmmeMemoRadiSam system protein A